MGTESGVQIRVHVGSSFNPVLRGWCLHIHGGPAVIGCVSTVKHG